VPPPFAATDTGTERGIQLVKHESQTGESTWWTTGADCTGWNTVVSPKTSPPRRGETTPARRYHTSDQGPGARWASQSPATHATSHQRITIQ
jgi:hypothetical protein